ncbi:hypothetical protein GCM10022221_68390 [Actinocorallia aurea]
MALPTRTVTGRYLNGHGDPAEGVVHFAPPGPLRHIGEGITIIGGYSVPLDATGAFTVDLIPTDVDGMEPDTWAYAVLEEIGRTQRRYFVLIPSGTEPLDLTGVPPVYPATELTGYVQQSAIGAPSGVASLDLAGQVPASQLGNVDTTSVVPLSRIPALPAAHLTSGILDLDRIPDLSGRYIVVPAAADDGTVLTADSTAASGYGWETVLRPGLLGVPGGIAVLSADGKLVPALLPDLDAARIASGILDLARIPELPASKVTAGQWATEQIPNLPATKITTGKLDRARLPDLAATGLVQRSGPLYAYDYGYRADSNPATAVANTAALQNALNDAANTWARVILPPGLAYVTTPGIVVPGRVRLEGAANRSSVLRLADGANCHLIRNHVSSDAGAADPNGMFIELAHLTLDARGAAQPAGGPFHGIYLTTDPAAAAGAVDPGFYARHLVDDVTVLSAKGDAFHVRGRSGTRLTRCNALDSGRHGFNLGGGTRAIDCDAGGSGQAAYRLSGADVILTGCHASGAGLDTSAATGTAPTPATGHGFHLDGPGASTLTGCYAVDVTGHGAYLAAGATACRIDVVVDGSAAAALALDGSSRNVIHLTSTHSAAVNAVHLTTAADGNTLTVGHSPRTGAAPTTILTGTSTLLGNRIIANGAPLAVRQEWAPSTAYVRGQELTRRGATYTATTDHTSLPTFTPNSNLLLTRGPWPSISVPPGDYAHLSGPATGTAQLGTETLRAFAWHLPHTATLQSIGAEIVTAGDTGSLYRLGIYADTGNQRPGALIADAGTLLGDSDTLQDLAIALTLAPGLYWVAGVAQAVTAVQPTLRTGSPTIPITSGILVEDAAVHGWTHSTPVPGALPATFVPSGQIGAIPRVQVRAV